MMVAFEGRRSRRDAPALRFLLLLLGGWAMVRAMANWNPVVPPPPRGAPPTPWAREAPGPSWTKAIAETPPDTVSKSRMANAGDVRAPKSTAPPTVGPDAARPLFGDGGSAGLHDLRFALMARLLPPSVDGGGRAAFPVGGAIWMPVDAPPRTAPPGGGQPYWMQRQLAGWSLGGWAYLRGGSTAAPGGIAAASQLGGSQAGMRLAYGFGDTGRLRAYARATLAIAQPRQRDLAFGLSFASVARWPVDIAVEQRVAVGSQGRTALAAIVSGGVGDVALAHGFRLEAYGQAGIVGAQRRDGFADGAVVVDREIAQIPRASVHLGGLAAGSVQPGAARVDVGPRLTLRLPHVGEGSRVALDWRQRVAGDAKPGNGVALTLASDF